MRISPKVFFASLALNLALSGAACAQAAPQTATVTQSVMVAAIASATPLPTESPTAGPTEPSLDESNRQTIEGAFSFISPSGYETTLKTISAEIDHAQDNIFLTIAIIGLGDDERTARSLLNDIFAKFEDVHIGNPDFANVADKIGEQADFNGILKPSVVSGSYVIIDLQNGVGLLAFGMGNVTQDFDSWQAYGKRDFLLLLQTIHILVSQ